MTGVQNTKTIEESNTLTHSTEKQNKYYTQDNKIRNLVSIPIPGFSQNNGTQGFIEQGIETFSLPSLEWLLGTEITEIRNDLKEIRLSKKVKNRKKGFKRFARVKEKEIKNELSENLINYLNEINKSIENDNLGNDLSKNLFNEKSSAYLINTSFNFELKGKRNRNLWNKIRKNLNYLSTELVEEDISLSKKIAEDLNDPLLCSKIARKEFENAKIERERKKGAYFNAYKDFVQTLVWSLDDRGNKNTMPLEYFNKKFWLPKARKKLIEEQEFSLLANVSKIQCFINKETVKEQERLGVLEEKLKENGFLVKEKYAYETQTNHQYSIIDKELINQGIEWILEQDSKDFEKNNEKLFMSMTMLYRENLSNIVVEKIKEKTSEGNYSLSQFLLLNSLERVYKDNNKNKRNNNMIEEVSYLKNEIEKKLSFEQDFDLFYYNFIEGKEVNNEIERIVEKNSLNDIVQIYLTLNLNPERLAYLNSGGNKNALRNYELKILEKLVNDYCNNSEDYLRELKEIRLPNNLKEELMNPINAYMKLK